MPAEDQSSKECHWFDTKLSMETYHDVLHQLSHGVDLYSALRNLRSKITHAFSSEGMENIPRRGPILIAANHPTRFDPILFSCVGKVRSDLRFLTVMCPEEVFEAREHIVLHKKVCPVNESLKRSNTSEVKQLLRYLDEGGSLAMVPWGINDYFAPLFVSLERSIENVLRMARRSQAHVLTANILPETYEEGENVWHSVLLKIGKPIPISNEAGVAEVITELYPK